MRGESPPSHGDSCSGSFGVSGFGTRTAVSVLAAFVSVGGGELWKRGCGTCVVLDTALQPPLNSNRCPSHLNVCAGLVFEAHRLVYHSTLGLRVIKKREKRSVVCHVPGDLGKNLGIQSRVG